MADYDDVQAAARQRVEAELRALAERVARLEGDSRAADKAEHYIRERFDRIERQIADLKQENDNTAQASKQQNRQIFIVVFTIIASQLFQFVVTGGLNVSVD
ncbi:MAG: hypothetical protein ACFBWO_01575 [Paracoccaceae bacterium]